MNEWALGAATALWLGILTSISPCPLATNVVAISFVGRRTGSPRGVMAAGLLYTAGRAAVYVLIGGLLVSTLLSAPRLSITLQIWMNRLLGPILILVGLVVLGFLRITPRGSGIGGRMQRHVERWGLLGALPLGGLFALSFCPVSAALYFGSLIPLSIRHGAGIAFPFLFGVGTALPVIAVAAVIAFGARRLGSVFDRMTTVEVWMRRFTGVIFIGVGIYLALVHIYGAL